MSLRRRACATVIAGVALSVCLVCASFVSAWAGEDDDPHAMLFSGRDLLLNGAFAHGGFLFAPSGLDQGGLLLKILFASGLYRYDAKNLGGERVIGAEGLSPAGGSSAAMWNSNFSLDPNFKNIIFSRMILPTDCAALHSACDWRLTCGTSRHPIPWSLLTPHYRRSKPLTRRALPMAGGSSKKCWEAFTSDRSLNISARTDTGICAWARTLPA